MTITFQLTKSNYTVPKLAIGILLALFGLGFFVVGFDQRHLFSLAAGPSAFDDLYLHELFHDYETCSRYPCH